VPRTLNALARFVPGRDILKAAVRHRPLVANAVEKHGI